MSSYISSPSKRPSVVIEPTRGWVDLQLGAIWKNRVLVYFLVWRDLKVRYKQSVLGAMWIVVQPLATMLIFTIIFHRLLGIESELGIPYPIFAYSGLLPWMYFANSLSRISDSLVSNRNLISKVYFPRLIIPVAGVLPGLVDFCIAFVILLGLMAYYGIMPGVEIIALPMVLLLATLTALGVGTWFSALNVQYRDVKYLAPFVIQIWMYATPIIYPIGRIPAQWRWLYNLNPMVSVVQGFRSVLLGEASFSNINWISIAVALLILVSGTFYFRRMERIFADVV